ncbi:hypothetical protein AB0I60_34655 [Actinosynnema sp. NPDC050436]|uniref:hypothetical protein n=1 Tax=Actinosynnema sp. NPDC050436 TaxID=3155659 RepID=UPI003411EC38
MSHALPAVHNSTPNIDDPGRQDMDDPIHSRDAAALLARAALLPGGSFTLDTAAAALGGPEALAAATVATGHLLAAGRLALVPHTTTAGRDLAQPPGASGLRYRWTADPAAEDGRLGVEERLRSY